MDALSSSNKKDMGLLSGLISQENIQYMKDEKVAAHIIKNQKSKDNEKKQKRTVAKFMA